MEAQLPGDPQPQPPNRHGQRAGGAAAAGGAPATPSAATATVPDELDPATAEILRLSFVALTDEMKTNLMRTAYNMIITEALDYTVGLFDAEGDTVSIGLGLPMFIRGMSVTVKAQVAHFGLDRLEPGDILLTNDAYIHGSHLNHMVFTLPVFWERRLIGFTCTMAHWQDIGGALGGQTTDIYTEGLQLPVVKIFRAGVQDPELTAIIRANVRFPDLAMGDFRAQIAAVRTGERRLQSLLRRYGPDAVTGAMAAVMASSEAAARRAVETIPDGRYAAESFMDDDGVVLGRRIPIHVQVTVDGDRMVVDLTDVAEQVRGHYNSGATAGRSAAQVAFKCLTTPLDLPINEGAFRPLEVVLPPGRVVSARKPAAMRKWMTIPMTVADTIFRALAPAVPDRVMAGHHADLLSTNYHGVNPRSGRFFVAHVGLPGGGWGAKHDSDGMSATVCINDGDTHNSPLEETEIRYPFIIRRYALRTDSGGAGRWRGGLGVVRVIENLGSARLDVPIERSQCAPWGLFGGGDALANRVRLRRRDGTWETFANAKLANVATEAGDQVWLEAGGGGGFGDPLDRPLADVAADVRLGYVSAEAAERDYGLRVDPATGEATPTESRRARAGR